MLPVIQESIVIISFKVMLNYLEVKKAYMKRIMVLILFLTGLNGLVFSQSFDVKDGLVYDTKGNLLSGLYEYQEDGQLKASYYFKNGIKDGPVTYYYAKDKVKETGFFKAGEKDGQWIRYNEKGSKIADVNFVNGKKHGRWILLDDQGNLLYDMTYNMGVKVGTWAMFDSKGEVVMKLEH
jgi:antitoxin component YwqK of YwqJK toxin-antitoxin module